MVARLRPEVTMPARQSIGVGGTSIISVSEYLLRDISYAIRVAFIFIIPHYSIIREAALRKRFIMASPIPFSGTP